LELIDKKNDLLKAAQKVFQEKGYKGTNVSDITDEAGMAVGSFYKYYKSKEEMFLEIYIQENEMVRKKLIDTIDWKKEAIVVIDDIFNYTMDIMINNNILAEWNKSGVSELLHEYYLSEKGKADYTFQSFLKSILSERLEKEAFDKETIDKIIKVLDLIYYMDCLITTKDFEGYVDTLRTLVKYFMKGVFS
jgi:AcrR family transcriptional regulator